MQALSFSIAMQEKMGADLFSKDQPAIATPHCIFQENKSVPILAASSSSPELLSQAVSIDKDAATAMTMNVLRMAVER